MIQIIGRGMAPIHCRNKNEVFLLLRRIFQKAEILQEEALLEGMEWVTTLNGRIIRRPMKGKTFQSLYQDNFVVPPRYKLKFCPTRKAKECR